MCILFRQNSRAVFALGACSQVQVVVQCWSVWSDLGQQGDRIHITPFGEGNVPWMVRELIRRAEPQCERQPRIVVG